VSVPLDINDLPPDKQRKFLQAVRAEMQHRMEANPADWFPLHEQQIKVIELPKIVLDRGKSVRVIMAMGGNGDGKSKVGMALISKILRREHPLFYQFRTMDMVTGEIRPLRKEDPITIWAIPPTDEKLRQDIWDPTDRMGLPYWVGEDLIVKDSRAAGNFEIQSTFGDKIYGKTQKQDLVTFESSSVHIVWFDEEPDDEKKFNSCLLRLGTTNGFILMTFTPLQGLSWSYERIYKSLVVQERAERMGPRSWIHAPEKGRGVVIVQMGTRDNPLAAEYADEVEADPEMSDAEKAARLYGQYGFVEGALLKRLSGLDLSAPSGFQKYYVIDRLPGQTTHEDGKREITPGGIGRWILMADPNKSFGAVLAAQDYDGNLIFVDEHLEVGWADPQHRDAFMAMLEKNGVRSAEQYADYGGAGSHAMVNLNFHGMYFQPVEKGAGSVAASIKRLRGLTYFAKDHRHPLLGELEENDRKLGAPRVYFYRPGLLKSYADHETGRVINRSKLVEQLSLARQSEKPHDPPDTPHKDIKNRLDLFDCARYVAVLATRTQPSDEGRVVARHLDHAHRLEHIPIDEESLKEEDRGGPFTKPFYTPELDMPY
jgi:phage terminase large subunit-like protein